MNLHFNGPQNVFRLDPSMAEFVAQNPNDPILLSTQTSSEPELLLHVVQYGDGYKQVSESSLRPVLNKFSLVFAKKPQVVIAAALRFFNGSDIAAVTGSDSGTIYNRRPSEFFYMTLPPPWQPVNSPPMRLLMTSAPRVTNDQWDSWTLTVNVEQWFGL